MYTTGLHEGRTQEQAFAEVERRTDARKGEHGDDPAAWRRVAREECQRVAVAYASFIEWYDAKDFPRESVVVPSFAGYLLETKPRRGWNNKIARIDGLLAWMYDRHILSDRDKAKKDSIFRQYYRYYNDGDFPQSLRSKGVAAYQGKARVEEALEEMLERFIKDVLARYAGKYNRQEYRLESAVKDIAQVKAYADEMEVHDLLDVLEKDKGVKDDSLSAQVKGLRMSYDVLRKAMTDRSPGFSNHSVAFARSGMQKAGEWDTRLSGMYADVAALTARIGVALGDALSAAEQAVEALRDRHSVDEAHDAASKSTSEMTDAEFELYLRKHRITGMAAVVASRNRRRAMARRSDSSSDGVDESSNHAQWLDKRISDLQHYRDRYSAYHAELERRMPKVREALKKFGLEVSGEVNARKTGRNDNAWDDDDYMVASIRAVPVGGRYKPILFGGYTSSGAGRNHGRLTAKANALADAIKSASGLAVQVNSSSMGVRKEGDEVRVLIDVWVKPELVKESLLGGVDESTSPLNNNTTRNMMGSLSGAVKVLQQCELQLGAAADYANRVSSGLDSSYRDRLYRLQSDVAALFIRVTAVYNELQNKTGA